MSFIFKSNLFLICGFLFFSCGHNAATEGGEDTATYGSIKIASDESFQPLVEAELAVFKSDYKYANIQVKYQPEDMAFRELLQDSVRLIFASRLLTKEENELLTKAKVVPKVLKIAQEAVCLIVNNDNPDSLLTMEELGSVFSGKMLSWSALGSKSLKNNIQIVFDQSNSSNLRFIREKFKLEKPGTNVFSANSNSEVITYVSKNKNTIGVIGASWISDGEDSTALSFTKSVKVVGISTKSEPTSADDYYQPYQAYIARGDYALSRDLYIISREPRVGLGTGFTSFVAGDRGQRIILKSGMVPATAPLRIVTVTDKPIN